MIFFTICMFFYFSTAWCEFWHRVILIAHVRLLDHVKHLVMREYLDMCGKTKDSTTSNIAIKNDNKLKTRARFVDEEEQDEIKSEGKKSN